LAGGEHLTRLAANQTGYGNLCRLLSAACLVGCGEGLDASHPALPHIPRYTGEGEAPSWPGKTEPTLSWELLAQHHGGLLVLSGCQRGPLGTPLLRGQPAQALDMAARLCDVFGREQVWIELQYHHLPGDRRLIRALLHVAQALALPCVASNDVHYASARESRLRDALVAVRHIQTLGEVQRAG